MKDLKSKILITLLKLVNHIFGKFGIDIPPVVGVCAIIKKGEKILAIKLSYRNGLALPGGRLNREESLEKGIAREIKEETGATVKKLSYNQSFALKKDNLVGLNVCFDVELENYNNLTPSNEGEPIWVTPAEFVKRSAYKDNAMIVKRNFNIL